MDEISRSGVSGGRVRATPRVFADIFAPNGQHFADGTVVVDPDGGQVNVAKGDEMVRFGSGAASSHSCDPNAPPPRQLGGPVSMNKDAAPQAKVVAADELTVAGRVEPEAPVAKTKPE